MENEETPIKEVTAEPVNTPEENERIAKLSKKGILIASIFGGVLLSLLITILAVGIPALNAANGKSTTWYKSRSGVYDSSDHWIANGAIFAFEKAETSTYYKLTSVNITDSGAKTLVLPSAHQGSDDSSALSVLETGEGSLFASSQYRVKDVYLEGFYQLLGSNSFSDDVIESVSFGTTTSEKYSMEVQAKAFENATSLVKVSLPSVLKSIDEGAFHNASALSSLDLSKTSLVSLGSSNDATGVFEGCSKLTSLSLPVTLTTLGKNLFKSTPSLSSITYAGTTKSWSNITLGSDWHEASLKSVLCSDGTITL
jgi:hypothetical protein